MPIIMEMTSLAVSQPKLFKTARSAAMMSLSVITLHIIIDQTGVMSNMPKML